MSYGESETKVRDFFAKARTAIPCVLFFDELDSISKPRGTASGDAKNAGNHILNQILAEMDGINAKKDAIIIGATNRPEQIDTALLRPGRLDQLIYIPLPDKAARLSILKANLKNISVSPLVDLAFLAGFTDGFSGADLSEICHRAAKLAIKESIEADARRLTQKREKAGTVATDVDDEDPIPAITKEHFEEALKFGRRGVLDDNLCHYDAFINVGVFISCTSL
jgi:transitional endoplasmic reticulum ATPase